MRRVCEFKGMYDHNHWLGFSLHGFADITPEITVYRYSSERVQSYLHNKVTRLSHQDICELSRTLTRSLAKDGLLEDGKETLLAGE